MNLRIFISLGLFLFFNENLQAQSNEANTTNSFVRMTEADIESLTKKLIEQKNSRTKNTTSIQPQEVVFTNSTQTEEAVEEDDFEKRILKQQVRLLTLKLNSKQEVVKKPIATSQKVATKTINPEINSLRAEVAELRRLVLDMQNKSASNITPIQKKEPVNVVVVKPTEVKEKQVAPKTIVKSDSLLNKKIDSLYAAIKNMKTADKSTNYTEDFNSVNKRLDSLQRAMDKSKATPKPVTVKEEVKKVELKPEFSNYKRQIFFGSNMKDLKVTDQSTIDELAIILSENKDVDVLVKGFASKTGNPVYNENLSLQRTESVKKALVTKGIHPTRILTQYHGIDYASASLEEARRVDIQLMQKK